MPVVWNVITESYTEPDGRECSMIDISAEEGDLRSIVISYGPMPEGSDAIMEGAALIRNSSERSDRRWRTIHLTSDFLGTTGYGFEVPTEDNTACNFICVAIGSQEQFEAGAHCNLFTILNTRTLITF